MNSAAERQVERADASRAVKPRYSIVVISFNTKEMLRDCLKSIYQTNSAADFEIIVVDNNSRDGSAKMVQEEFADVRLIENSTNRGFAAANNQAIPFANGAYLILLNSDTVVLKDGFKSLLEYVASDDRIGLANPKIVGSDGALQLPSTKIPEPWLYALLSVLDILALRPTLGRLGLAQRLRATPLNPNHMQEVERVRGSCLLVSRKLIEQIGALDERFFFGYEEVDIALRAKKAGWRIAYFPHCEILHYGGGSHQEFGIGLQREVRTGLYSFYEKHYGWFWSALVRAAVFMTSVINALCRVPFCIVGQRRAFHTYEMRQDLLVAVSAFGSIGSRALRKAGKN